MYYSQEFKERCKAIYPNRHELHQALDAGSEAVGRQLLTTIFDEHSLRKVLRTNSHADEKAIKVKEIRNGDSERFGIYSEWCTLHEPYKQRQNEIHCLQLRIDQLKNLH